MGRAKEWMMEQQAQGFDSKSSFVCTECINDDAILRYIETNGDTANECSYCDEDRARGKRAVPFDDFVRFVLKGIETEWGDPNSEAVGWDHGWQGKVIDSWDLVTDELEMDFATDALRDDLISSLTDRQWCQRDFYALKPHQAMSYGWREFTDVVKHRARYVFFRMHDEREEGRGYEEIAPSHFLDAFGEVVSECDLYRTLPPGATLYRVRLHQDKKPFGKAIDLGAPPPSAAKYANRMSAAGIPAFYGAFEEATALSETVPQNGERYASIGVFKVVRDLLLADLSKLPPMPSIFEPGSHGRRHGLTFLRHFLVDFTAAVEKDGREHIEYVPTQIVAEYLRLVHTRQNGRRIDGIIYPSAKEKGKDACVLFIDSRLTCDAGEETKETVLVLTEAKLHALDP